MASADDPPLQIFLRESSCYENGPARAGATKSSASYGRPTKAKARSWRKKKRPRHIGGAAGTVPDRCAFGRRAHKASAAAVVPISCWNSFHANLQFCCFDQERLVTL